MLLLGIGCQRVRLSIYSQGKSEEEKLSGDRRKITGKFFQESVIVGHPCYCQAHHWQAEYVKNVAQGG